MQSMNTSFDSHTYLLLRIGSPTFLSCSSYTENSALDLLEHVLEQRSYLQCLWALDVLATT